MKVTNPFFILALLLAWGVAHAASGRAPSRLAQAQAAIQWQRWEHVLTARKGHPHPHTGVEIDVILTGPDGASLRVPAFWDGDRTYRFRAAFPATGLWRWRTMCSDASDTGLHGQAGEVRVAAYTGDNPLYRHGDLRVSADRRYLVHADGTPFLWMGDTGWYAAWNSNPREWRAYVDTRARQRFSVLQIIATGQGTTTTLPASGYAPFLKDGAPNPDYWRTLEEKLAYANDRGLMILLTGVGAYAGFATQQLNPAFARYLAGRFAGHMILFSPSMDQRYDPQNDQTGAALARLTTHLVTQHPGTDFEAAKKYRDNPSIAFSGLQSGHHRGDLTKAYNAARTWTLELWNHEPIKPVIDIEAMYDAYGNDNGPNWREQDARKLGWIAWLSGSRGYTYGAGDVPPKVPGGSGGLWKFDSDPSAYDYWRKAVTWPSAAQMTLLHDFFASIEWWRLEPAPRIIKDQAQEETRKIAVSRSKEGDLFVAYLPDNDKVVLDLMSVPARLSGTWFNPVNGRWMALKDAITPAPAVTLRRPDGWADAVLLLKRDESAAAYYPPPEKRGGWRALVRPGQPATQAEKKAVLEKTGLDWDKLQAAWQYIDQLKVPNSFLVIRHGWIAGEWSNMKAPKGIASSTKSMTSLAMARLFDLNDAGKLARPVTIDDPIYRYLPAEWGEAEPARQKILLRHALTMTSGLTPYDGPYKADYLQQVFAQKVEAPPGTVWAYNSAPVDMLSLVIENATGRKLGEFFNTEIGSRIGAAPVKWGRFSGHDGGSGGPEGGTRFPARELARIGYLVLHDGVWEMHGRREQVLSAARLGEFTRHAPWLESTRYREPNFAREKNAQACYGCLWWTNHTGSLCPDAPRDMVYTSGWGKQACWVVPSLDMVVVRVGPHQKLNDIPEFYCELWTRIMAAVHDRPQAQDNAAH